MQLETVHDALLSTVCILRMHVKGETVRIPSPVYIDKMSSCTWHILYGSHVTR